ncbi:MAG TPA: hypothetical protein VD735_00255 [Candidatus Saccharimonadales bacterium]|nr:hypothetical protein [Candidatus Saccharimonadales bacterium]
MTDKFIIDQLARDGNTGKQSSDTDSGSAGNEEMQHTGPAHNDVPKSMPAGV